MYVVIAYIPSTHTMGRAWQCELWEHVEEVARGIVADRPGEVPLTDTELIMLKEDNCVALPDLEIHVGLLE